MARKTYRVKLQLAGDDKPKIYRTDGVPTHCCSLQAACFVWERNTKYNNYDGWSGYISESVIKANLKEYNPDNLQI